MLIVSSCQSTALRSDTTLGAESDAQSSALADGKVTLAEYQAGFLRYSDCMTRAGYPLVGVKYDPQTLLYSARIPNRAVETGADSQCYSREFYKLDLAWQTDPARSKPPSDYSSLGGLLSKCLTLLGVPYPSGQSAAQLQQILEHHGYTLDNCLPLPSSTLGS